MFLSFQHCKHQNNTAWVCDEKVGLNQGGISMKELGGANANTKKKKYI
jgi:hypothetical protein